MPWHTQLDSQGPVTSKVSKARDSVTGVREVSLKANRRMLNLRCSALSTEKEDIGKVP